MKILIADTYYTDVFRAFPLNPAGAYDSELRALLNVSFGTSDFYSRNLTALGHECMDVIYNHHSLQRLWQDKTGWAGDPFTAQLMHFAPDVLFLQDLNISVPQEHRPAIVAAQLSCPWPGDEKVKQADIIFSSFPHFIPRIEKLGVRAVYLPLAFDPIVLERAWDKQPQRIYDCVFVGGVGNPGHWRYGMEVLETVAREIPTFKWWGYGYDTLPRDSALRDKYQGQAFGLDMYRIFLQSRIVLNRHGEVAEGYANNMRMFEATGCGALLFTEKATNLRDLFANGEHVECVAYGRDNLDELITMMLFCLHEWGGYGSAIAARGQARTLRDHTYAKRMEVVSETLMGMLSVGSLDEARNPAQHFNGNLF